MKLLDDWKRIARKAWSVRLMLAAGVLSGCEAVVPMLGGYLPRRTFAVVVFVVVMSALVARFVAQRSMRDDD
jgi:hypothetical protein